MDKVMSGILLRVLLLASLLLLIGCDSLVVRSDAGTETQVIMLRHAERTPISKVLTERGHERARALAEAIGERPVDAIFSPDLERNLDTVRPLAKHKGVEIIVVSRSDITGLPGRFVKQHAGQTVVWVGNTSNLEWLFQRLGGTGAPPDNYGDLFFLTIPDQGTTRVIRSRFGD